MTITITQPLSPAAARRLLRSAKFYAQNHFTHNRAFIHVGPKQYAATSDNPAPDLHAIARNMMLCAGSTFRYELTE